MTFTLRRLVAWDEEVYHRAARERRQWLRMAKGTLRT
jgi:hypothetical protein